VTFIIYLLFLLFYYIYPGFDSKQKAFKASGNIENNQKINNSPDNKTFEEKSDTTNPNQICVADQDCEFDSSCRSKQSGDPECLKVDISLYHSETQQNNNLDSIIAESASSKNSEFSSDMPKASISGASNKFLSINFNTLGITVGEYRYETLSTMKGFEYLPRIPYGAIILAVSNENRALELGLKKFDIITKINDQLLDSNNFSDLFDNSSEYKIEAFTYFRLNDEGNLTEFTHDLSGFVKNIRENSLSNKIEQTKIVDFSKKSGFSDLITTLLSDPYNIQKYQEKINNSTSKAVKSKFRNQARELNDNALNLLHENKVNDAIYILLSSIKLDQSDSEILNNLSSAYGRAGGYNEQIYYAIESLSLKPDRTYAWDDLARGNAMLGNNDDSMNAFIVSFMFSKNKAKKLLYFKNPPDYETIPVKSVLTKVYEDLSSHGFHE
jgi:uncharacterized protein YkvS